MIEEIRRVIQVGKSSLAITIPKRWADALGLESGSCVLLRLSNNKIEVEPLTPFIKRQDYQSVCIDVVTNNADYVLRRVLTQYLKGVDEVRINFLTHNVQLKKVVKDLLRRRVPGAEIVEEGFDYIVVRLMPHAEVSIRKLLNRLSLTVQGMLRDALEYLKGFCMDYHDIVERDNEVDRLFTLLQRLVFVALIDWRSMGKLDVSSHRELVYSMIVGKIIERTGDRAWRIAELANRIRSGKGCESDRLPVIDELVSFGLRVLGLFKDSISAFLNANVDEAYRVLELKDMLRRFSFDIIQLIYEYDLPPYVTGSLVMIAENLRRISEHCLDVAEVTIDAYG